MNRGIAKGALVAIVAFVALAVVLVMTSLELAGHSCEVCMEYRGRHICRTVSGASAEEAKRAAVTNACAFIARGVTETMACQQRRPLSENCR